LALISSIPAICPVDVKQVTDIKAAPKILIPLLTAIIPNANATGI
jgi:hypothetical protein